MTFTKMAAHDGIRSCDDPASVAPRVVASDETKYYLTKYNATQIRHHHRYRRRKW